MHIVDKIETLSQIAERQSVVTTKLQEAIDAHGEGYWVISHTEATPFGSYFVGWSEVDAPESSIL